PTAFEKHRGEGDSDPRKDWSDRAIGPSSHVPSEERQDAPDQEGPENNRILDPGQDHVDGEGGSPEERQEPGTDPEEPSPDRPHTDAGRGSEDRLDDPKRYQPGTEHPVAPRHHQGVQRETVVPGIEMPRFEQRPGSMAIVQRVLAVESL